MILTKGIIQLVPVLPSADIARDVEWYEQKTGFLATYTDAMYAVLRREGQYINLQWHADTTDDPLLGGSVLRIFVHDIHPYFKEFVERGTVSEDKLRLHTPWGTNEFGFFDLNKNALFIAQELQT